jgi:hypothetical protein
MFDLDPDDRISAWSHFRANLNDSATPFNDLIEFWQDAPFIPYNRNVDPFNQYAWPTPWDIIVENHYDDFTKSLMMAWTLKLTDKFKDSKIEIKTYADDEKNKVYNLVIVNNSSVINYNDNSLLDVQEIPDSIRLENLIEVNRPR